MKRAFHYHSGLQTVLAATAASLALAFLPSALAAEAPVANAPATNAPALASATNAPAPAPADAKGAPLPLHQIEGNGGIFSTLSAYIVNPPRNGEAIGRPSVGAAYVNLGHGYNLEALTLTESPLSRLELGYGWDHLSLGDLPSELNSLGLPITKNQVQLHNFNVRYQLVKENDFDQAWLPAITLGSHYKVNDGIAHIDSDLGGALSSSGITHHTAEEVTLYGSKTITQLGRPVILELGGRATPAVWDGLGGFSSRYDFLFEGNVVVLVTDRLALAAEYKQQANEYKPIGELVRKSGDWWTIDAAYVINNHWTVAAGYGNFGGVLNHNANGVWGLTTKYEF